MTIIEFLEDRIAEDEREANVCLASPEHTTRRWRRVLAECAAKRAVIMSYRSCLQAEKGTTEFGPKLVTSGMVKGLEIAIKSLASVYSDDPAYEAEWSK